MKEALIILLVLAVIVVLTAVRYRKQIATALHIWRSFKKVREQIKNTQETAKPVESASTPLVNCARCGTWIPETRAIRLRGGTNYCSTACLEKTANVG